MLTSSRARRNVKMIRVRRASSLSMNDYLEEEELGLHEMSMLMRVVIRNGSSKD